MPRAFQEKSEETSLSGDDTEPPTEQPWWKISFEERAACVGALGGITFGYDIGVVSGALVSLREDFGLGASAEGLVVGMLAIGQMPGALVGGYVCDHYGRKAAIYAQNVCYLCGTLVTAGATSLGGLLAGQFVVGVGVAFSVASNIAYVTEMVPAERSGAMVALYELATTFGVLLAYLVFLALSSVGHAWRVMYLCGLAFPVLQSAAVAMMPESPKWLFSRGRLVEAKEALLVVYEETEESDARSLQAADAVAASHTAGTQGSTSNEPRMSEEEASNDVKSTTDENAGSSRRRGNGDQSAASHGLIMQDNEGGSSLPLPHHRTPRTDAALLALARAADEDAAESAQIEAAMQKRMQARRPTQRQEQGQGTALINDSPSNTSTSFDKEERIHNGDTSGGSGSGSSSRRDGNLELSDGNRPGTETRENGADSYSNPLHHESESDAVAARGNEEEVDDRNGNQSSDDFEDVPLPLSTERNASDNSTTDDVSTTPVSDHREMSERDLPLQSGYVGSGRTSEQWRLWATRQARALQRTAHFWRGPLLVVFTLIFFTFFTGGINIRIYAPTIFGLAGLGESDRAIMTVLLGCIKVVSTGLAVVFIDSTGRRVFFLAGLALMAIAATLLVAATAALGDSSSSEVSEEDDVNDSDSGSGRAGLQALVVVGCLLYTIAYQLSFGPGIFILGSEMFPPAIRGRLLGLQTLWGSACLAFTSDVFPALAESWSLPAAFSLHLGFIVAAVVFVATCVVETRGKSPETIRRALETRLFAPPLPPPSSSTPVAGSGPSPNARNSVSSDDFAEPAPLITAMLHAMSGWRRSLARTASRLCCPSPPDDDGGSPYDNPEGDNGDIRGDSHGRRSGIGGNATDDSSRRRDRNGTRGRGSSSGGKGGGRQSMGFEMVSRDPSFSAELV